MKFGYARVSTTEQNLDLQIDALEEESCDQVFSEKISSRTKNRPELETLLGQLRKGDELIIYKLDRIARSTTELLNLIERLMEKGVSIKSLNEKWADTSTPAGKAMITVFAGFAEFERDLIRQRTSDGREAAKKRGVRFGRPSKLSSSQKELIKKSWKAEIPVSELAASFNVSRDTIYRVINFSTEI